MSRKILIITNPGEPGSSNFCEGVYRDVENYNFYFKEPYGGYWKDHEIVHLDKPSKFMVDTELVKLSAFTFTIIIFCGHGFYSSQSQTNILELNKSERYDSIDLRKNASKRIIILDNCRKVLPEYLTDHLEKGLKGFSNFFGSVSKLDPERCLRLYNQTISDCNNQILIADAASIGEEAGDSAIKGGYYSSSLIDGTNDLVDKYLESINLNSHYLPLRFPECHDAAIPKVHRLSGGIQNPQLEKPRVLKSTHYLPFGIIA